VTARYPGFEHDPELPWEYELFPVLRDDAAIPKRVRLEPGHETAATSRGQVDMPL
jgi:hypothetical protein